MKSLKLIIALFTLVGLVSCSEDDSTTPVDQNSLIGTWSLVSLDSDIDISSDAQGIPVTSSLITVGENLDYTITFTEDTYAAAGSYDIVTTGTILGIPIDEPQRQTISDANQMGTYSLENDELIIDGDLVDLDMTELPEDFDFPNTGISFNADGELVMRQFFSQVNEEDGTEVTVDADIQLVWRRDQ